MRYVPVILAEPGMILAYDVYDSLGRILISHQNILTQSFIDKLMEIGIDGVYVDDELSKGIEIEQVISPELRAEGLSCVRRKDVDACKAVAKKIVDEILSKGSCSLDMMDLRSFDDYTFAHSVNVATICCTVGLGLNLSEDDLENLVFAALLHDMGKLEIPPEILNKPERLTREEYMLMKTHSMLSYEFIKERIDISAKVKQAVLYHHENMDGSGYPNGVLGEELSIYARILHVADVYDALVSKRPYKNPYSQWEALEFLKGGSGALFAEEIVEAIEKYVPFYPKGSFVVIEDGREGIVVDNKGERNIRPLIRLFDGTEIDLLEPEYMNIKIVNPSDESNLSTEESERERLNMIKGLKRCKVFLIDSTMESYDLLNNKLRYLYDIEGYRTMNLAIGMAKKNGMPDLFIYDADKNDERFEELAKLMEYTNDAVPVMVVASAKDKETILKYRDLRIMRYVLKPYTTVYIRSELRNLLHNYGDIGE